MNASMPLGDARHQRQSEQEESARIARGWIEVVRLAERERRKDAGEPLVRIRTQGEVGAEQPRATPPAIESSRR